ncbi:MAG: hypothetical protein M1813_001189 [Trichoglossum hirsutum]|nr:MAG: hypothetical protein M1813_001189 [Trichoglossum hirsutum]
MHSLIAIAITSFVGFAASQTIDPSTVPIALRSNWCLAQTTSCPLICLQTPGNSESPQQNTCDAPTLSFSCVCSNGATPNATEYSQTIPYFICTESNNECVNNCGGNSGCQSACRTSHPCGAQDPQRVNITSTSTFAAKTGVATGTGKDDYAGFGTSTSAPGGKKNGGPAAIDLGQSYGAGLVMAGVFAGFALFL